MVPVSHFLHADQLAALDKRLARYALDHHKPLILCANKWDLVDEPVGAELVRYVQGELPGQAFAPVLLLSARTGEGVEQVLATARSLFEEAHRRAGTGELNRVIKQAIQAQSPPIRQNRQGRVYFATQVAAAPPTIVLFTNGPELFDNTYQRYLLKWLRDSLPFGDVPIKLYLRNKRREDEEEARPRPVRTKPPRRTKKKKEVGELWDV